MLKIMLITAVTLVWVLALLAAAAGLLMGYLSPVSDAHAQTIAYVVAGILAVVAVTAGLHWRIGLFFSACLTVYLLVVQTYIMVYLKKSGWAGLALGCIGVLYIGAWFAKRSLINKMQSGQ